MLTQYEYDGLGRPCKIIGSSNQVTVIRYDDAYVNEWGQKTRKRTVIDPLGNQTEEIFDNTGHLIKVSKRDKTGHLLAETESSYDLSGNKVYLRRQLASLQKDVAVPMKQSGLLTKAISLQSITLGKGNISGRACDDFWNTIPMEIWPPGITLVLKSRLLTNTITMAT